MNDSQVMLRAGDLIFARGSGPIAALIRFFTRTIGESRTKVDHVGIVVEGGPLEQAIVVEALHTKVERHDIASRYRRMRRTAIGVQRRVGLTDEQVGKIVAKAESYVDRKYGWATIVAHALDWLLLGAYFFRRFIGEDRYPICSWVVAFAYQAADLDFAVPARAADPDDIWDFVVETRPDLHEEIRAMAPLP